MAGFIFRNFQIASSKSGKFTENLANDGLDPCLPIPEARGATRQPVN